MTYLNIYDTHYSEPKNKGIYQFMKNKISLILLGLILLLTTSLAKAESQNFDTWATTDYNPHTITNNDWILSNGFLQDSSFDIVHSVPNNAFLLESNNTSIQTPRLFFGIGEISFYCKLFKMANATSIPLQILSSTDNTNWTLTATVNCDTKTWQLKTITINNNNTHYIKVLKNVATSEGDIVAIDDINTTIPPATVTITDVATIPGSPEINDTVDVSCKIIPSPLASSISATLSYSVGTNAYTSINMTASGQPNEYITASKIPGHEAGTKVNYYITAIFSGNEAQSPTNYPAGGANAPAFYKVSNRDLFSDYKYMDVIGSISNRMIMVKDYQWRTVIENPADIPNATLHFQGTETNLVTTKLWGDSLQNFSFLPIISTAILNDPAISIAVIPAGQTVFQFNETTLDYIIRQIHYQDFDSWPDATAYNTTTYNNWLAVNAKIETPLDPDRKLREKAIILNSNDLSWIQSPYIEDGIGEISFWYRNWNTNGIPTTECYIQTSVTGGTNNSEWTTIDTVHFIETSIYRKYSLSQNDYNNHYLRILVNTNAGTRAALCIDELMILYGGSAVSMTNLTATPSQPIISDPIDISVDITPIVGASNLQATTYYRTGSFGNFIPLLMSNTVANTYKTITPIPAGSGDANGAGLVEYYIGCSFDGLESDMSSPMFHPTGAPNTVATITIEPSSVTITNVTNTPDPVHVNTPITITADIMPENGTIDISPSVYYRVGNSGNFTEMQMDNNGSPTNFITINPIPGQSIAGDYIQYYLEVDFIGPGSDNTTNYPANGYITIPIHVAELTSNFDAVNVVGSINTNLDLIENNIWLGIGNVNSNIINGNILFDTTIGAVTSSFGDNNQSFTNMPVFGTVAPGAANIIMGGTNSGNFTFRFDETNNSYSAQLCEYVDFEAFNNADSSFATYTNSDNWVISNARITALGETSRAFRGNSCILNSNSAVSYVQSPNLVDGIGEISFWYRNWWESSDTEPITILVQKSIDGIGGWETIATIDDVINFNYLHFSGFFYEPDYHYVRIVTDTDNPHATLLLDEIVVSKAGPGAVFANLSNTPLTPNVVEPVSVSVDIDAIHYAADIKATLWYRFGTNGIFDSVVMSKGISNTYTTVSSIPRGYDGTVEYYVEANFEGIVQAPRTITTYPASGEYGATNYLSSGNSSFFVDFDDWSVTDDNPNTITNNGWVLADSMVKNGATPFKSLSSPNAAWLLGNAAGLTSYLQSPESSYGIGSLSFYHVKFSYGEATNALPIKIFTSENGTTWKFITTVICTSKDWQYNTLAIDDSNAKYIKMEKVNTTLEGDIIGLDNIRVTYPASIVDITDVKLTPEYPTDSTATKVTCTITSANAVFPSANISAQVHYKLSSETNYTIINMTKNGDNFTSTEIPPMNAGEKIEYYITSQFSGYYGAQSDNRSPSYFPIGNAGTTTNQFYTAPTNTPAAYYVRQDYLNTQHSFDAWTNSTLPGTYLDKGWKLNQAQVSYINADAWFSSPYAVELLNDGDWEDSYIESPVMSNGVGTLSFFTKNRKQDGNINLQILISRNGGSFEQFQTITSISNAPWTRHSIEINESVPTAIRIKKGDITGAGYTVLLDNIEISYIPSAVQFGQIIFNPGYPAVGQDVYASCKITAATNLYEAANNITAKLYYRNKSRGETTYSGPLSMILNGDKFITFSPIPASANGSRDIIEFYIEANFNGYHYKSDHNSHSPSFYPEGNLGESSEHYYTPPSTPAHYQVRPYISEYSDITVVVSNITVTMTQGADHEWNGFLFIDADMPDTYLWLNGNGFYTGTNYASTSDIWSDTNQWRTTLPFAGTMQDDATGTLLFAPERGAYLIRFNEYNRGYIIERAAFQDFNTWPANPDYFEASFSQAKVTSYQDNFNDWPNSTASVHADDFETWETNSTYINASRDDGDWGWLVGQAKIIDQLLVTNPMMEEAHACQLYPEVGFGEIKTTVNSFDGTGYMKVEYRCTDSTFAPTLFTDAINWDDSMIKGTFKATAMPYNSSRDILGSNIWISLIGRYIDDRNYYELRKEQVDTKRYQYGIYKIQNGSAAKLTVSAPQTGTLDVNAKEMHLLISTYDNDKVLIEAYEDKTLKIQTFDENNPITMQGKTGIRANGIDIMADDVLTGISRELTFKSWPAKTTVTSFTKDNWTITYAETITGNSYVELLKTSVASGSPAVISPILPHGAGNISVCAKRGSGSDSSCKLIFQWSTDKTTWNTIANSDITISSTSWNYYDSSDMVGYGFNITNENIYLRLVNDTVNSSLFLDNIMIEPSPTTAPNWDFETDADGWFASYGNWFVNNSSYNGAGVVNPVSFAFEAAPNYTPDNWERIANVLSKANIDYETVIVDFNIADPFIPRLVHTFGQASLVVNSIEINSWHGKNNSGTNGWQTQAGWVTSGGFASNCVELTASRALKDPNIEDQFLMSPLMTNGVGTISFNYIRRGSDPIRFILESNQDDTNGLWNTLTTVSNSVTDWTSPESLFTYNVRTNDSLIIRIRNISPTNSHSTIRIDNAKISDFSAKDEFTWTAYNALISATSDTNKLRNSEGNVKGGYLNNNPTNDVDAIQSPLNIDMPYIQSGYLQDGIGEISFWYRAWDSTNIPTLRIKIAPEIDTPASNWVELTSLYDITNTEYEHFKMLIYDATNHYVRFYADTDISSAGRICLDDIIVTAPFGAEVSLQNISVNPEIPLKTDSVYISATVTRTFLNPSNITLTAYWRSNDTNNWGEWKNENPLPMEFIDGNSPIGTWQTIDPIPALPIDSLVQYYVEAAYDGIFSEKSSPKEERTFTNPEWYFPVDLNSGTLNTNPYYYVFSCLPGEVWFNEINIVDGWWSGVTATQYVEIAGLSGININNWNIEVVNNSFINYGMYKITDNYILQNDTNNYGFWILGDASMGANADMNLSNSIPEFGAVRLYRSMGAIEDGICFGDHSMTNDPNSRLMYIGTEDNFFYANPLSIIGEGSNRTDFTEASWVNDKSFTPNAINDGQTLPLLDAPLFQIQITDASLNGNQVWLIFHTDATYNIQPEPWYSTNLLNPNGWIKVPGAIDTSYNNGVYTQKFNTVNSPVHSYKVIGIAQ